MDAQHQEISTHSLENMMVCPKAQERKPRPQPEQALKCPRCDSSNTKFCYYNNYSLSQPRYFCKSCRRYWTQGGTLRNVPVGGGCRKNKRSSSSSTSKRSQDQSITTTLPSLSYDHQANDLSLAFARLQKYSCGQQQQELGFNDYDFSLLGNPNSTNCGDALVNNSHGFLDVMRNGYNSQNLYYGNVGSGDNNNMGGIENGGNGSNVGEMRLPYDHHDQYSNATTTAVTVTTMKQELFGGRENENRILWGYPNWQMNGDNGNMGSEFDNSSAGRESWNGINASSWHGLLNSPLM